MLVDLVQKSDTVQQNTPAATEKPYAAPALHLRRLRRQGSVPSLSAGDEKGRGSTLFLFS